MMCIYILWLMTVLMMPITAHASAPATVSGIGADPTIHNQHTDMLGSPVAGTNEVGAVTWRKRYTPFGEKMLKPMEPDNQASFTRHIADSKTGLTYMQARYYDPNIGRFLSIDPVTFLSSGGDPRFFNRYVYTFNDPVNLTDPTGRNPGIDHRADAAAQAMRDCGAPCVPIVEAGASFTPLGPYMDFAKARTDGNGVWKSIGIAAVGAINPFKKAEKVGDAADAVKGARKGASTTLTTEAGETVVGNSTRASRTGGAPQAPTNPQMQEALDGVSNPSGTHGACCEIDAMNQVLNDGGSLPGAKMGPVIDNATGAVKQPCSTCREVMEQFGVK